MVISTYLSIITVDANELNAPIKKHRMPQEPDSTESKTKLLLKAGKAVNTKASD